MTHGLRAWLSGGPERDGTAGRCNGLIEDLILPLEDTGEDIPLREHFIR